MKTRQLNKRGANASIRKYPYIFCSFFFIFYFLFSLYPTIYSFVLSLHKWNGIKPKEFVGFANYAKLLFNDREFWISLWVTIKVAALAIPGQIAIGLILAVLLFNLTRGKRFFQTIYFGPYIISSVALAIMFRYFFEWENGYLNNILMSIGWIKENIYWLQTEKYVHAILTFMNIWRSAGYSMVIFLAAMSSIPTDIYEAAKVDGANKWHTFWRITIPELKPMINFILITSIISGFQFFELPSMIYSPNTKVEGGSIGGPGRAAFTVMWKFYADTFQRSMDLGYGAAITYVLFVLILGITIIVKVTGSRKEKE